MPFISRLKPFNISLSMVISSEISPILIKLFTLLLISSKDLLTENVISIFVSFPFIPVRFFTIFFPIDESTSISDFKSKLPMNSE